MVFVVDSGCELRGGEGEGWGDEWGEGERRKEKREKSKQKQKTHKHNEIKMRRAASLSLPARPLYVARSFDSAGLDWRVVWTWMGVGVVLDGRWCKGLLWRRGFGCGIEEQGEVEVGGLGERVVRERGDVGVS